MGKSIIAKSAAAALDQIEKEDQKIEDDEQKKHEPIVYTPTMIFDFKKDSRFWVEDHIFPATVNMVYSPPEQGKSLLSLYQGLCISNGLPFLGQQTTKAGVLYCDRENCAQFMKTRLMGLHAGLKLESKDYPMYFIIREGELKTGSSFVAFLTNFITTHNIKVVYFDTLHRFAKYEENRSDEISALYTDIFQPIADKLDCSVVFLHHTDKAENTPRGSGDFMGMVDMAFRVRKSNDSNRFSFECVKGRQGRAEKLEGEFDFDDDTGIITVSELDPEKVKEERRGNFGMLLAVTRAIMGLFSVVGEVKLRGQIIAGVIMNLEFIAQKVEPSKPTIDRSLRWLCDKEFLKKEKKGYQMLKTYGRGF